jgi:glycosyltransferase involved in cell wall biosynthesis
LLGRIAFGSRPWLGGVEELSDVFGGRVGSSSRASRSETSLESRSERLAISSNRITRPSHYSSRASGPGEAITILRTLPRLIKVTKFTFCRDMPDAASMNPSDAMEATPTLSIITPVYNGEKFISECIESVAAQNCAGVEHVIVDGGSSDWTVQILREKARVHPYLRWISEPDRGQSDALNKGIGMARAEYIGILNADDFYEPGALSCVVTIIKNLPEPRFIVGACNVLTTGDKRADVNRPSVLKFENLMINETKWPFPYNPSAYFYPKAVHDVVGPYNIEDHFAMDFEFVLAVVQAIKPLYVDVVLGNFRLIPGTKTFNSIRDGSNKTMKRKIRIAAWKRASFKIKLRVAFLWMLHRLKVAC